MHFCRSLSMYPLERVESFFWRSKWRIILYSIKGLSKLEVIIEFSHFIN